MNAMMHVFLRGCVAAGATISLAFQPAQADVNEHKVACNPVQSAAAKSAVASARSAVSKAVDSFKSPAAKDVERQQKWFGALDTSTASNVRAIYERTLAATAFTVFWCPLKNDIDFKWNVGDLAAVHASAPGAIFLTPAYFQLATTGADSQMGTVVHELTHVVGVGLKDEVYGVGDAKKLAASNPASARNNSDNFQYYVEDLVFGL